MSKMRIGTGFDAHRFGTVSVKEIKIGGVNVPYHKEVLAHSDGDVLLHALCDALLGALALGDIGHHFPDTNIEFKGVDSRHLLRATVKKVVDQGYKLANVDMTLIAEAPRVANYIDKMRMLISEDLGVNMDQVSVKATTTERMG
ncbi:MAG: 2-C-methyl-D-erythritol 2,4-cyclodiphosphate synthase, partial [Candidatus Azotimanducaceae bacterium]